MTRHDDRTILLALLRINNGPKLADVRQAIIEDWDLREVLERFTDVDSAAERAAEDAAGWAAAGNRMITFLDPDYPPQLRDVHDFPPVIFVRGTVRADDRGVCVVGSREANGREIEAAADIARLLVEAKLTVVSGLARGIDAAAHTAALTAGGRTVGVLGSGIDRYRPKTSEPIQRRMEHDGLVLSQFWPGFDSNRQSFPMRNATMSAYGQATVILAAGETSGTRHQARQAIAHGRPLILSASVAANTTWGRKYAESSAEVAVARSADAAVAHAVRLVTPAKLPTIPAPA